MIARVSRAPRAQRAVSGWTALWLGLRAQPLAFGGAFLATWAGLVLAIAAAGLGLIGGGVSGAWGIGSYLVSHALGSIFTSPSSTPFDGGLGAAFVVVDTIAFGVIGAVGAFGAVMSGVVTNPGVTESSLLCGAMVTVMGFAVAWWSDLWVLGRRGCRRLSWDEWVRLHPLRDAALLALGIPRADAPILLMQDSVIPTAYASLRAVVLSTGLCDALDDTALSGVLAHEFAHWRAGHPAGYRLVWLAALPLAIIESLLVWLGTLTGNTRTVIAGALSSLAWLVFWPVHVAVRFLIAPLYARRCRAHEYAADAQAAAAGDLYREGLRLALTTLVVFEVPPTTWQAVLVRRHPPTPLRVERLVPPPEQQRRAAVRRQQAAAAGVPPTP